MTMNLAELDQFFKSGRLNSKNGNLTMNGHNFSRMYLDYYVAMINAFKNKVSLEVKNNLSIRESSWEPLMKSSCIGTMSFLKPFLQSTANASEMGKLMIFFEILNHCGFGSFELGLGIKGAIMTINVSQSLENHSDIYLQHKTDKMISPFTGGLVLAAYNMAMSDKTESEIDDEFLQKLYRESPDVIQSSYGLIDEESQFSLVIPDKF